jgi:hypothetical protein
MRIRCDVLLLVLPPIEVLAELLDVEPRGRRSLLGPQPVEQPRYVSPQRLGHHSTSAAIVLPRRWVL